MIVRNILLISPEPWGTNKVSKHHYAFELAKRGNNVFFLNPNSGSFQVSKEVENLYIVNYKELLRGVSYFPKPFQALYFKLLIQKLEKRLGTFFNLIWNFDSSRFYELSKVKGRRKVCHIVDMNQNYHRDQLAKSSDVCFCTSDFIFEELKKSSERVFKVNHGYQNDSYARIDSDYDLTGENNLKCLYLGNIGIKYLDWTLIRMVVEHNPNVDFYFIGPDHIKSQEPHDKSVLKHKPNVYFKPPIISNQIPVVLKNADILLVAYDTDNYLEQVSNPHKVMEYMGSGKTIVSSYIDEFKDTSGLLEMGKSKEEVLGIFNNVVSRLEQYNSEDRVRKRVDFALDNTYSKQIDRIEVLING